MNKLFYKFTNLKSWKNRISLFLAIVLSLGFAFYTLVGAQVATKDFQEELSANKNSKGVFDYNTTRGLLGSLVTGIGGCEKCPQGAQSGAIEGVGTMIAGMYENQPVSGVVYAFDVARNMGFADKAYAQTTGTGFNVLSPLLGIWRGFRNFAYGLFVIMFVVMGLAVMFRMKLNPQTVITIQSAIPRIVVALLLVTFSYAIAGFVIDLIYLSIALLALMFGSVGNSDALRDYFLNAGGWQVFQTILSSIPFKGIAVLLVGTTGGGIGGILVGTGNIFARVISFTFARGVGIGAVLVALILLVIALYVFIHLFMDLLGAYVAIIMAVVFGPIQIALGVIPGLQGVGFGAWFRNLIANAAVFPTVAFILMFAVVIQNSVDGTDLWDPPLLAGGGTLASMMPGLIAFGTLLIAHQIPDAVKKALGGTGFQFRVGAGWREAGGELVELGGRAGVGAGAKRFGRTPAGGTQPGIRGWFYDFAKNQRWTS